ncbi:hypothetical protein [Streptomyces sp. NBC_01465]|uniref:hypothetical protein n=1 Tax=Streptomyces sp. NBC_01465 TaxID=2903878 RepID=UPI002E342C3C|nr:hypothetical protein [Streptomyces sp. NBC_01465]
MPSWITPRRLGVTAVLYAVFVGGWFLGQPLAGVGCDSSQPDYASDASTEFGEPGDVSRDVSRVVGTAVTYDIVSTQGLCRWEPRPRLVAWVLGDWR